MSLVRLRLFLLHLFFLFHSVQSQTPHQECGDAVFESIGYVIFAGDDPLSYYNSSCLYPPKVLSIYAGATKYCKPDEIIDAMRLLNSYCEEYGPGLELLPIDDFKANLTEAAINSLPTITYAEALNLTDPLDHAVLITPEFFGNMYRTVHTWDRQMKFHHDHGFAMYGFWGGILFLGIINHAMTWFFSRQSSPRSMPLFLKSTRNFINKWFTVPFLYGNNHQRLRLGFAIPTRLVGLVVFVYWVLSIVLCASNYETFVGNL
jgi:hypothetical protein